jgi:hypothetical protein
MLVKINMHTKQAPEFDLESQIHYSSCLFLPVTHKSLISTKMQDFNP